MSRSGLPTRRARGDRSKIHRPVAICQNCGKQTYETKKAAKGAARRLHPGEQMNAYRCATGWHYGHLDPSVIAGLASKAEVYGNA